MATLYDTTGATVVQPENSDLLTITFSAYGLDAYGMFLRCKRLPSSQLVYDWRKDTYTLTTPVRFAPLLGLTAQRMSGDALPLASHLFDFQGHIVDKALAAKRFAVWLDTGLGKTNIQLEWSRQVLARTQGRVLILAPLAIIPQTIREATRFYRSALAFDVLTTREALDRWCQLPGHALGICNYEKLIPGVLPSMQRLAGLAADEASILKSSDGVIKWNLIKSARGIEYKLACTATPAPNDVMEFASQASFLETISHEGDVLWTYFSRDKHGVWSIKPHARQAFYRFLASWSVYLRNPARFGWQDILATLPSPVIEETRLGMTDEQQRLSTQLAVMLGTGLFSHDRLGIKERTKLSQIAKGFVYEGTNGTRKTRHVASFKPQWCAKKALSERQAGRQVLLWTVFDEESAILEALLAEIPYVVKALHGVTKDDARLEILQAFVDGEIDILISKPQLLGYGLNFQHCRSMIFSGFDDSFERLYQAVRRCYRYGQTETVYVHVPYVPELEGMIFANLKQKEMQFVEATAEHETAYLEAMRGDK